MSTGGSGTASTGGRQVPVTGGAWTTGGITQTGGHSATGGKVATGGTVGGAVASGGVTVTGGSLGSGGSTITGGSASGGIAVTGGTTPAMGGSSSGGAATGGALATGGTSLTGGTAGAPSTGGTTSSPDAGKDTSTGSSFACNLVLGNSTTQQWFDGGFLTYPGIDANRWELRAVAHHYIGSWASATDSGWTAAFDNGHACSNGSQNPDRVIFIVTQSPPYATAAEYQKDITAIVKNIKAKYSNVKRIELTTLIRSPGNSASACSSNSGNEQSIPAAEDDGIAAVVADPAFAGSVFELPPFYVTACSDFNPDAPQYTTTGATNIAKVYGAYWSANP